MKKKVTVALLENASEFGKVAATKFFGKDFDPIMRPTFVDVFRCLEEHVVDHAVVPVENLVSGSIGEVYDLLFMHNVFVTGEVYLKEVLSLVASRGGDITRIETVYASPEALLQCHDFLRKRRWKVVPSYNIVEKFRLVRKNKNIAAITSEDAAKEHGLRVLQKGIQDFPWNVTRYFSLGNRMDSCGDNDKTSLAFVAKHLPGALFQCLEGFAKHGINLSKIESRPVRREPNKYSFFIDFDGNIDTPSVQKAMDSLREKATYVKILGCYQGGLMPTAG